MIGLMVVGGSDVCKKKKMLFLTHAVVLFVYNSGNLTVHTTHAQAITPSHGFLMGCFIFENKVKSENCIEVYCASYLNHQF
jgi:hypothetical protein